MDNIGTITVWCFWQIYAYKKRCDSAVLTSIYICGENILLLLWFYISIDIECDFVWVNRIIIYQIIYFPSITYKRQKHIKLFLSYIHTTIKTSCQHLHPNWKVNPLLNHMIRVSWGVIFLGRKLSCYERIIGFQINHK